MRRGARKARLGGCALLGVALALLPGWDTHTLDNGAGNGWYSIHAAPDDTGAFAAFQTSNFDGLPGNEHTEIAHYTLSQLGWSNLYTTPLPTIVDLNASVWHPEVAQVAVPSGRDEGDDASTPLLERRLPHPARFAGVPDYSWTVTDWINRNRFCAALPTSAPNYGRCHELAGWLGAISNSSHFGDQATAFYRHFHSVALDRAAAAGRMGAAIQAARSAGVEFDDMEAARFQREAELLALSYETFAQHFLQDRWSSGHTFNRWNAASYEAMPRANDFLVNQAIGAISGVVHGAEAVLIEVLPAPLAPDPLCSPEVLSSGAVPIGILGPSDSDAIGAIGDYRFTDGLLGTFGEEYGYGALPIEVSQQLREMRRCTMAGYADVARAFAANPDGTRGAFSLPVAGAPGFDAAVDIAGDAMGETFCFDHWATNAAMSTGINTLGAGRFGRVLVQAAQAGAVVLAHSTRTGPVVDMLTGQLAEVMLTVSERGRTAPNGTDVARGRNLPALYGVQAGQTYVTGVPPSYAEPVAFSTLPLLATEDRPDSAGLERPGRDQRSEEGYFNLAHAPDLCERAEEDLAHDDSLPPDSPRQGLRWPVPLPDGAPAEDLERRRQACIYLADRLFEETRAWYQPTPAPYMGRQREARHESLFGDSGDSAAPAAAPMCKVLGATPVNAHRATATSYWIDNPVELHPGYVDAEDGPYTRRDSAGGSFYASLDAYCRAVPVVDVDDGDFVVDDAGARQVLSPGFDAEGKVHFEPEVISPQVTIHGHNFGEATGRIKLVGEHGCNDPVMTSQFADIAAWSADTITFELNANRFPPDVYHLEIIRDDRDPAGHRVRSVGRFLLDVRRAVYTGLDTIRGPFTGSEVGEDFRAIHPYCAGATILRHTIDDCTDVLAGAEPLCGADQTTPVGTRLWTGPAPSAFAPGPYAGHRWAVTSVGECETLPFSSAPCPAGLPIEYGLVWRMELTGPPTGAMPPRSLRFTLAWQRPGAP